MELNNHLKIAFVLSTALVTVGMFIFTLLEPAITRSQATTESDFTVTQNITGAISLAVGNVTMVGDIDGLLGGNSTGTTQAVVTTNDPDGYTLQIRFPFATTSAMQALASSDYISNYTATSGNPSFQFTVPSSGGESVMGYTVIASSSLHVGDTFEHSGSDCTGTGTATADRCWVAASTSNLTIMDTPAQAFPDGSTSTIKFRVAVPASPSPSLSADTYVATATLTATNK